MSDTYRLGPALLHTSDDSTAHAPETIRSTLLRALDSSSRVAVALTCKAGLQWLLTEWPDSAALQLAVRPSSAELPDSATLRRMQRARQWLSVRGDQPTSLKLVQQGQGPSAEGYWGTVIDALGSGYALPGLSLSLHLQHISPSLLQLVGNAYPELTTLSLGNVSGSDSTVELPPPATLRALRHLTIHRVPEYSQAALWASVAPYLAQLTSLTIVEQPLSQPGTRPHWSALFSAPQATPITTLKHLSLAYTLCPWLARVLCQSLPALEILSVAGVFYRANEGDGPIPTVCPWRTLVVTGPREDVHVAFAAWMPLPARGRLVIDVSGGPEGVAGLYLKGTAFENVGRIELRGCRRLDVYGNFMFHRDKVQVLRQLVPHLALHASPDIELQLNQLIIEPKLAAITHELVAQGWTKMSLTGVWWLYKTYEHTSLPTPLPPLHELKFQSNHINEETIAAIQRCLTSVEVLGGDWDDQYLPEPGTRLPWRTTRLWSVSLSRLLTLAERLPDMSWDLRTLVMRIDIEKIESGEYLQLAERLRNVRITRVGTVEIGRSDMYSRRSHQAIGRDAAHMRAGLLVSRALTCPVGCVRLGIKPFTLAVAAGFIHLPEWHTELQLCMMGEHEPSEDSTMAVARAVALIPRTYHTWDLGGFECTEEEFSALVSALPTNRRQHTPLTVHCPKEKWVQSILAVVQENEKLFPHIKIA